MLPKTGELVVVEARDGARAVRALDEAEAHASGHGLEVLRARPPGRRRAAAFAIARQLFEPALARLDANARAATLDGAARLARPLFDEHAARPPEGGAAVSVVHGLYWLAVNLADRRPLALLVDDVHRSDEPSLRLLVHVAQRIDELPIALVVGTRPRVPGPPAGLLGALTGHHLARRVRPAAPVR